MTSQKLQAALTRMLERGFKSVELAEPIRRQSVQLVRIGDRVIRKEGPMVDTFTFSTIAITAALEMIRDRDDFTGIGTGRNVRRIVRKNLDRTAEWKRHWNNSGRGCVAFHADQRTAV